MNPHRARYEEKISRAKLITSPGARASMINSVLLEMRRDKAVPHLQLCAFLQDHSTTIKEITS